MRITTGFELESIVGDSQLFTMRDSYHSSNYRFNHNYRVENDGSLNSYGVEIVSKPHTTKKQLEEAKKILFSDILQLAPDITVDSSCGFHVNFSIKDIPISRLFLFSCLRELREQLFLLVPEQNRDIYKSNYVRSYAKQINTYRDYRQGKYYEFNIKDDYIEWRGVHLRHLHNLKGLSFLVATWDFYMAVRKILRKTLTDYLLKGKEEQSNIEFIAHDLIASLLFNTKVDSNIRVTTVYQKRKYSKIKILKSFDMSLNTNLYIQKYV